MEDKIVERRAQIHRNIYIVLVALLGGCMMVSTWASNLVWVLLGANWLLEGRWREKWQMAKESRLLQAYIALYLLLLVGMSWTENQSFGWSLMQVKMPLLFVPLVMLTTRPIEGRARHTVLALFAGTATVVTAIGLARWLTIPGLPYRDIVPYISHIRFALCCCMAIVLIAGWMEKAKGWARIGLLAWLLWLLAFLLVIRSYTAILVLGTASLAVVVAYRRKWQYVAVWVFLAGGLVAMACKYTHDYYKLRALSTEPLREYTINGNPYCHARDGIIENGNYVNNYICHEELQREWERRSAKPYGEKNADGYSTEPVLVRYLNSLGLTKDSVGMAALTEKQLAAVERGVANHVYEDHDPLRKMAYTMLFEMEHCRKTHAVAGFTMLQRMELWDASIMVIADNPWFGVGTGDVVDAISAHLAGADSPLAGRGMRSHNQYLGTAAALGLVGLVLILLLFVRPLAGRQRRRPTPLMLAWIVAVVVSMLTEDTLDTLAGILFCTWFLAIRTEDVPSHQKEGDKP